MSKVIYGDYFILVKFQNYAKLGWTRWMSILMLIIMLQGKNAVGFIINKLTHIQLEPWNYDENWKLWRNQKMHKAQPKFGWFYHIALENRNGQWMFVKVQHCYTKLDL